MWKGHSIINQLNYCTRKHWIPGIWVAIDEQTIGFKGRSGMKLWISYKREGDGFQCIALCDAGYTFSFFFRHGDAPKIGREYDHLGLSDVHLLSMVAESVKWMAKQRKVYHQESRKMRMMSYLRLNVIDDYNNKMNNVDIADQLRGHHRPDHCWMRHKKWWWAIFMWGIGVARVNAYKIYEEAMWDEEKAKGRTDLPAKWTTGDIEQLAYDMMFPEQTLVHRQLLQREEYLDDSSIKGRSLSLFGSTDLLQTEDDMEWDFS